MDRGSLRATVHGAPKKSGTTEQLISHTVAPQYCVGGCSLEGLMLKLKLQFFGHLMQRVNSLEKT